MTARVITAIAGNPEIWKRSAIVIAYDESDGFYDHVPPRILSYGPDHLPLARGIRTPLIVISPYARRLACPMPRGCTLPLSSRAARSLDVARLPVCPMRRMRSPRAARLRSMVQMVAFRIILGR